MASDRLIYASAARRAILREEPRIAYCLDSVPSVDAVEVVRCKDCDKSKRSHLFGSGWRFCMNNSQHHKDEHFCSYGERKEA
jgi:hypothetical protein